MTGDYSGSLFGYRHAILKGYLVSYYASFIASPFLPYQEYQIGKEFAVECINRIISVPEQRSQVVESVMIFPGFLQPSARSSLPEIAAFEEAGLILILRTFEKVNKARSIFVWNQEGDSISATLPSFGLDLE